MLGLGGNPKAWSATPPSVLRGVPAVMPKGLPAVMPKGLPAVMGLSLKLVKGRPATSSDQPAVRPPLGVPGAAPRGLGKAPNAAVVLRASLGDDKAAALLLAAELRLEGNNMPLPLVMPRDGKAATLLSLLGAAVDPLRDPTGSEVSLHHQ